MTRRRLLCGLLLLSAVLACVGGWLSIVNAPNTTRARFERVKKGMSREEVRRTVGQPPGYYVGGQSVPTRDAGDSYFWHFDDGQMQVRFDYTDRAIDVLVTLPPDLTLTERLRRWLGL